MRSGAFTAENVCRLTRAYSAQLNESGAFARDALRWGKADTWVDSSEIDGFAGEHFLLLDGVIGVETGVQKN